MAPKKYNVKDDLVTGKEKFLKVFNKIYRKELEASPTGELSGPEISRLRNHPDLGFWSSNGKPISIESVNAHIRWLENTNPNKSKNSPLKFKVVTPSTSKAYTREHLESQKSITREAKNWIKRLNATRTKENPQGAWPPGVTEKNIFNDIGKAASETGAENLRLKELTGIDFQKGHGWGVMGMKGSRTWVVPYYGARMEGHFNFRNVAPQPDSPSLKQFLHPFWNSIIPNVPSRFSKHGVQISSAEDLRWAGGGGQGWSGTMADILLSKIPNANIDDFDKLPLDQKAYVLFADPEKGGGANPEARYFEIKNGQWENIKKRIAPFAAQSHGGPVTTIKRGSPEWWRLQKDFGAKLFREGSATLNRFSNNTSDFIDQLLPKNEGGGLKVQGDGTAVLTDEAVLPRKVNWNKLSELGNTTAAKQISKNIASSVGPTNVAANIALNPSLMEQVGARVHKGEPINWKGFTQELGKDIAWDTVFGGATLAAMKKLGPAAPAFMVKPIYSAADAYVKGATDKSITDRYMQYREDQAPFSDKRIKEAGLADINEYNLPTGPAEIKQWNPSLIDKAKIKTQQLLQK